MWCLLNFVIVYYNSKKFYLSQTTSKFHIIYFKPAIADSELWTNMSKTGFKSESLAYELVPCAKLHMSITFNAKTYIIMNVHIKKCGIKD